jgi:type VI secretion system secreted protein Hcp
MQMAFDGFMKIEGAPGESLDAKHKDWIELLSYGHSVEQPVSKTASSSGGASAERVNLGAFFITKQVDKASPKLFDMSVTGKHIKSIVIEICRSTGGEKLKYYEIKMEQVLISNYSHNGNNAGTAEFPTETILFVPGKINVTYVQQKRTDGQAGGQIAAGWDAMQNKVC